MPTDEQKDSAAAITVEQLEVAASILDSAPFMLCEAATHALVIVSVASLLANNLNAAMVTNELAGIHDRLEALEDAINSATLSR